MNRSSRYRNPFAVETPEQMTAKDINDLYVPVPADDSLSSPKHMIMHGHRGCGKSMIFRRMSPDCQMLLNNCTFDELDFLGVYLSIKYTSLDVAEYEALGDDYVATMFSEHALICHLSSALFTVLRDSLVDSNIDTPENREALRDLIINDLFPNIQVFGFPEDKLSTIEEQTSISSQLKILIRVFDLAFILQNNYFKHKITALVDKENMYNGPLFKKTNLLCSL